MTLPHFYGTLPGHVHNLGYRAAPYNNGCDSFMIAALYFEVFRLQYCTLDGLRVETFMQETILCDCTCSCIESVHVNTVRSSVR